ncbi:hypothetical protein LSTR_LSTR014961 [Laodelphax striatellus]|uniref:Uncharacterized protein n=1 Tax=Laodelphax striatellus TaxID=195883 RepID=A0A482X4I1_LAOST|nr:hypothetical protein LSTR_LSTR014961 [Laodelphax striatellus]
MNLESCFFLILLQVCDQPVHITIESHGGASSHPPTSIEPVVFPPPPEFSGNSSLPTTAYGNIFISVSVGQDGNEPPRYPDLLDLPHRKSKSVGTDTSAYYPALPSGAAETSTYFTTLPRQPAEFATLQNGVTNGPPFFTTLPRQATNGATATEATQFFTALQTTATDGSPFFAALPRSGATDFATLPRKPNSVAAKVKVDQCISTTAPTTTPKLPPHYDNMGPRVTAKGSCSTLSLPDATTNNSSTNTLESQTEEEDILPPPPPPPLCSPLTVEYVSL